MDTQAQLLESFRRLFREDPACERLAAMAAQGGDLAPIMDFGSQEMREVAGKNRNFGGGAMGAPVALRESGQIVEERLRAAGRELGISDGPGLEAFVHGR